MLAVMMPLEYGSIEVVVGEESTGRGITPGDHFDTANIDGEIERLTGAIVETVEPNEHEAYGCLGVWTGLDALANVAKISLWRLDP